MTATTAPAEDLTERQQQTLDMVKAGKTPTEIGKEQGISSQAVHGTLRRLREKGLIPEVAAPQKAAGARRGARARGERSSSTTPAVAFNAIRQSIVEQREALEARATELDSEIEDLKKLIDDKRGEKRVIEKATKELTDFEGTMPA